MTIDSYIALVIIAIGITLVLAAIFFLIKGLKENKIIHTALAGNVLIVASTISALCYMMIL